MSLETELYEERRRKWRRSSFWRGFLVAIIIGVILFVIASAGGDSRPRGPHIARFEIAGTIFDDSARDELLAELRDNSDAKAIILRINSPGGTTVGAEALFAAIREVAAEKPVVAVMGEMAASGGYAAAIAADHVVARGNTLTGSIGVIMEYPNVTGLMDRIGVEMETFRSSDIKADASPFRDASDAGRLAHGRMIADSFDWFRELVSERRELTGAALEAATTGGVFTGRQALDLGLVDAIGGETTGIAWLESVEPELANLPVESWEIPREEDVWSKFLGQSSAIDRFLNHMTRQNGPRLYSIFK